MALGEYDMALGAYDMALGAYDMALDVIVGLGAYWHPLYVKSLLIFTSCDSAVPPWH